MLRFVIVSEPDVVQQHVEYRHRDGGDKLADPQRCREIGVDKIIEYTRDEMKRVAAAENERRKSHMFFRTVHRFRKDHASADNRKDQIKDVKSRFSVFHPANPFHNTVLLKKARRSVLFSWRRRRDLNPCAGYPTYSLSRGAPSPLGYFSMVNLFKNIILSFFWRRGRDSNSWYLSISLVFKTSSINRSDTPPYLRKK